MAAASLRAAAAAASAAASSSRFRSTGARARRTVEPAKRFAPLRSWCACERREEVGILQPIGNGISSSDLGFDAVARRESCIGKSHMSVGERFVTHEVENQVPALGAYNAYLSDTALRDAVVRE